jgi:hypothetical protein
MNIRRYEADRDEEAVLRIFREVGWLDEKQEEQRRPGLRYGAPFVAGIGDQAECYVRTVPGTICYLGEKLAFCCVEAVVTSRVARKQGLAARLTAEAVAASAADGAAVAGLGIFDQGFYDRLGFGTGGYELFTTLDPKSLNVDITPRVPSRISKDDWEAVHACRLARPMRHGHVSLLPPEVTRFEMGSHKNGFGLGYYDGRDGELTHHLWFNTGNVGSGPYNVEWIVWHTREQFLELMALIRDLGDQVLAVRMREPAGMQLQDLVQGPFRRARISRESKFETNVRGWAYWQMRVLDLQACLDGTHLAGAQVRFNLELADPIERFLTDSSPWRGVAGSYVVTLGESSSAEPGTEGSLPTLTASVNAFTRLWLGVLPAAGLALTDDLAGPPQLLDELDGLLRLPPPRPDWGF